MQALVSSLFPVCNSFAILFLITCIYATLFTYLFGGDIDVNDHFSSFSVSLFTMFQVCVCVCVCLSVCLFVCQSVCLSACLPACLSVCLSVSR